MDMFANPNIGAWVVEQVPCSFAKPDSYGRLGTHYSMVLLDKNHNLLYAGSECEHKHGEGVQAIHEMSGGKDSCYTSSEAFRHALSLIHEGGNLPDNLPETASTKSLPPTLAGVLRAVWTMAVKKHNERSTARMWERVAERRNSGGKLAALQGAVDRVTASLLGIHPRVDHGRNQERVHNTSFAKTELIYPQVFRVVQRYLNAGGVEVLKDDSGINLPPDGGTFTMMEFVHRSQPEGVIFAVRDFNEKGEPAPGKWAFSKEAVRGWAHTHHTVFDAMQTEQFKVAAQKKDHGRCIFCGEDYDRMFRHIKGAKHGDRVVEVAGLVCKATTRLGLKMLNDPHHRTAFIKDR